MTPLAVAVAKRPDGSEMLDSIEGENAGVHRSDDGLAICSSQRITNRLELALQLGLPSDVELNALLLVGWRRWGTGLADRLRGPFALVIHCSNERRTYVARDSLGIAPVYYAWSDTRLAVADSSRAVRSLSGRQHAPDRRLLVDFLSGGEGHRERTYFEGVHRLPPGNWLTFAEGEVRIAQYWSPASAPLQAEPGIDLPERFREHFDRSLAACYQAGSTGLMLSGGLDSSAIAGSLAALGVGSELIALSMTYHSTPGWHDLPHLEALKESLPFSFEAMAGDEHDPLEGAEGFLEALDGPYFHYGQAVTFSAKRMLGERGVGIVLTGHGGDEVVSYGAGRLNELAVAGRWGTLWRDSKALADLQHLPRWKVFVPYLDHIRPVRRMRGALKKLSRQPERRQILTPDAASLLDQWKQPSRAVRSRADHDERMVHEALLSSAMQAVAFEVIALSSRAVGVETRMPFCDRDLVEFCLSLPPEAKLGGGYTRRILREAMRGRVPPAVLARNDKFDFTGNFIRGLLRDPGRLLDLADPSNARLSGFVAEAQLKRLRTEVSRKGTAIDRTDAFLLWRVAIAAMWLELENRPVNLGISPCETQH